jgi:Na+-transporting methylmalonyl-CoA/oxaloacetate decarboxylase gamma subunit
MYGLEAIDNADGWQMAAIGVSIVFLSLILLAIVISQLHVFLEFWDRRMDQKTPEPNTAAGSCQEAKLPHPSICPEDIQSVAAIWLPLVAQLGDPFHLPDLYAKAADHNFPHPHLTINRLRQAGILVPADHCLFSWNMNVGGTECHG